MRDMVKWNGASTSLRRLEELLQHESRPPALPRPRGVALTRVGQAQLPPRIDLVRGCAQHDGSTWAAVYLLNAEGGYEYSTSIVVSKTLYRTQYAPGVATTLIWDDTWIDEETSALCGVAGRPVRCGRCRQLACRGRSSGQYFRCFCGNEGWIEISKLEHLGVIPRLGS